MSVDYKTDKNPSSPATHSNPSLHRLVLAIFISVWTCWYLFAYRMVSSTPNNVLVNKLEVALRQIKSDPDLLIGITVTNAHTNPLTFVAYDSPLDELVFQRGLLSITLKDATEPAEFDRIMVNRQIPPRSESIVTLEPGEGRESRVSLEIASVLVPGLETGATVVCKGRWMSVWEGRKDELNGLGEGGLPDPNALTGDFESVGITIYVS